MQFETASKLIQQIDLILKDALHKDGLATVGVSTPTSRKGMKAQIAHDVIVNREKRLLKKHK